MSLHDVPGGIGVECGHRIVFQRERSKDLRVFDRLPSVALVRLSKMKSNLLSPKLRWLKMSMTVKLPLPEIVFQQVNSRCLLYRPFGDLRALIPSSASRLWNVQRLIIKGATGRMAAPPEIWKMRQLRHLEFNEIFLPDPPTMDHQEDALLQNLQTLMDVVNFCFSKDVCKRIPNVKKLHISYDDFSDECLKIDIGSLSKLQSLKCSFDEKMRDLALELTFPSSLQKWSLIGCFLHFNNVTTVVLMLPNLQVLNLDLVTRPQWNLVEEAFPRLKSLSISNSDLIYWTADGSHFPVLEKLLGFGFVIPLIKSYSLG